MSQPTSEDDSEIVPCNVPSPVGAAPSERPEESSGDTVELLRARTQIDTSVEPRVARLIDRLGKLGAMLGGADTSGALDAALGTDDPPPFGSTDACAPYPAVEGFRLVEVLGSGGMGTVYLAEESSLARRVVLKLIRRGVAADADARARFIREARAMAAVVDDNVMPVHRVDQCDAGLYFTMPLLTGESLADRLDRASGPLPHDEALGIFRQIASGLQAIHAHGLVHRDIKPSNIWLESLKQPGTRGEQVRTRILDFGVAFDTSPSDRARTMAILGTPGYMSPEQAAGGAVDARSDLFSLGAVGYRMWTGRPPFAGDTLFALLSELALRDPSPADVVQPSVRRPVAQLLERLLRKDASSRPGTAADVLAALQSLDDRPPLNDDRRRGVWLLAPFLLLALAAVVIIVTNKRGERATIDVPDGAHVEVTSRGDVHIEVPGAARRSDSSAGDASAFPPLDDAWVKRVRALPPGEQLRELAAELQRRNPRNRESPYTIGDSGQDAALAGVGVFTDRIDDVTPVAALRSIARLQLIPTGWQRGARGRLRSLEPLRGMDLEFLDVKSNPDLTDLSPLAGMQLNWLNLTATGVRDLSPLADVELTGGLLIEQTEVADLSPIAGQPLAELLCADTRVRDLSPLASMRLMAVSIPAGATPWTALAEMPLERLRFTPDGEQDLNIFRRMATLKEINGRPADVFWRDLDSQHK